MKLEFKSTKPGMVRLITDDFDIFSTIRDKFSYSERNFAYIKRCRHLGVRINPEKEVIKKYCIKGSGEFELGMLVDVLRFCKSEFYTRTIKFELDDKLRDYLSTNELTLDQDVYVNDSGAKPRDYQIESMQIALNKKNGVFLLGTGAGKTLCTALLIHNLLKHGLAQKILVICPFPDLANQTCDEISKNLQKHPYSFGKWFGKHKFDASVNVIVAGSDIIRSQFDEYSDELKKFDAIIVDEVHQLKASNKITAIMQKLPAKYRYGFTGTLPEDIQDEWALKGKIGPVRYELSSAELRKDKFLTPVQALILHLDLTDVPTFKIDENGKKIPFSYMDEVEWLSGNPEYAVKLTRIAHTLSKNILILTNRLEQNKILKNFLGNLLKDKQIFTITGGVELEERADIKQAMEANDNVIVIATVSCFSTGINVKNIHNIIFPGLIGKANTRIVQSIGRGLRLNPNKAKLNVIDIVPNTKYAQKHLEARKLIYSREKIPFKEKTIKLPPVIETNGSQDSAEKIT